MSEIILWSLLAFFSAFGLVEFVRLAYAEWNCPDEDFHVVLCANKFKDNIEGAIRSTILTVDVNSVIVVADFITAEDYSVYEKLIKQYPFIRIMNTEEYIDYIRNREC